MNGEYLKIRDEVLENPRIRGMIHLRPQINRLR